MFPFWISVAVITLQASSCRRLLGSSGSNWVLGPPGTGCRDQGNVSSEWPDLSELPSLERRVECELRIWGPARGFPCLMGGRNQRKPTHRPLAKLNKTNYFSKSLKDENH